MKSAKKAAKVAKELGYSNDINPFGDSNLLQPFVWGKKVEKRQEEKKGKRHRDDSSDDEDEKRIKLMKDIDRIRKRRDAREKELEDMEKMRADELRLREAISYGDWEEKEEEFHLEQTKVRSKIRLLDNRERPIDLLAKNILLVEAAATAVRVDEKEADIAQSLSFLEGTDITDPVVMVVHLSLADLRQLLLDVEAYLELEEKKKSVHVVFWECLREVVLAEIERAGGSGERETDTHRAIKREVETLLKDKSIAELEKLHADIMDNLRQGVYGDSEYWEGIAKEVSNERNRLIVRATFDDLASRKKDAVAILRSRVSASSSSSSSNQLVASKRGLGAIAVDGQFGDKDPYSEFSESERQVLRQMEGSGAGVDTAEGVIGDERMQSSDEVALSGSYKWQGKYTPRKPRFYNRVKSGYYWNRYNKTHYDYDNPPPKLVQGYRFTLFYPDLIDNTVTPKYFLSAASEPEFAIIRFHAGPPYEDIAFKIVNNEWDTDRRAGFRVTFERGVMQLNFNFKRHIYKR
jgi:hypothetical protein